MTRKRSAIVLTPAIDGRDGISALGRQVVGALVRSSTWRAVEVWALDGGLPAMLPATVVFWSAGGGRSRLVRRAVGRAVRGCTDVDVLVLHLHLAPLARLMGARGADVTDFLIGIEAWTPLRRRERRALAQAQRIVSISDFTTREFRRANPDLASLPVVTCAPGVGDWPHVSGAIAETGFALIVGRLSASERYKGHDALIDVWPSVLAAVPDAKLVVAGDGDDRRRLEAAAAARGLAPAIRFAGRVDDQTLAGLYAAASFFVMPSAREGFGLVFLEAMQAGKPCVAAHGSADEIIRHGIDGLIVDADAPDQLTAAVVRLFSSGDERLRMGAAARQRVRDVFSEQRFDARLLEVIGPAAAAASPVPQESFS